MRGGAASKTYAAAAALFRNVSSKIRSRRRILERAVKLLMIISYYVPQSYRILGTARQEFSSVSLWQVAAERGDGLCQQHLVEDGSYCQSAIWAG